ncbi:phage tail spike protein [Bacillus methanolicus]|uniref:phage tail spike protein n=1 Tax=Bacillus methanolicus TaxID=1471 RepID=UPI00200C9BC9|nr:phage tail spike protein [Bacillus methanolicus]
MMIHVLDGKTEQILATLENKHGYPALFWDDRHIEKEENSYNTYEFTTVDDGTNPAAEHLINKNKIIIPDLDGYFIPFTIEEVEQDSTDGKRIKRVYAEGEHVELRTAKIIEPIELIGATLEQLLDLALYNTRWEKGIVEFAGSRTIKIGEHITALAFLNIIQSEFDIQLRFRVEIDGNKIIGRYVDALVKEDVFDGKEITFGKDLKGIRRNENSREVYTALYAIGPADENGNYVTIESVNNGLKYVEDLDALERWSPDGRHLYGIFQYQPETDEKVTPSLLKQKAQEALKNYINSAVKYEVDAVVLERITGLEHEKIRNGMTIRIKDEKFNPPLYLEARVLETERSYTAKDQDKFVLGNYREVEVVKDPTIAKIQSKLFRNENAWSSSARVIRSATPPEDTHAIWIDITKNPEVPMTYDFDTQTWKKASPTVAQEIGAETPEGAQEKANQAEDNAKSHADEAAATAEQNAKEYVEQYTQQYAEQKTPDVIPAVPTNFTATGSFKKVILMWDLNTSKTVSHYELYGSQTSGFTPNSATLIWKGKESAFIHEVNVNQTWYYRLRAVNVYGKAGAFTQEVSATTAKIISDDILFGAVNAQHLAELAVTAEKLADEAVTSTKIASLAVGNAAIQNGAITNAKIATAAVGTAQIQDLAVTNAKIANLAVDDAKIASLHGSKITANSITADKLNVTDLSAISANLGTVTAGTIDASKVNITNINASNITTGTLSGSKINGGTITGSAYKSGHITNPFKIYIGDAETEDFHAASFFYDHLYIPNLKVTNNGEFYTRSGGSAFRFYIGTSGQYNPLILYSSSVRINGQTIVDGDLQTSSANKYLISSNIHSHSDSTPFRVYIGTTLNYNPLTCYGASVTINKDLNVLDSITCVRLTQTSDRNKKKDIITFEDDALDLIKSTTIYSYFYENDDEETAKRTIGVIAQEAPSEIIQQDKMGVDIYSMISIAWKAIQQQQEIIESLQKRIENLEQAA